MTPVPAGAPACTGKVPPLDTPAGPATLGVTPNDGNRCVGISWGTWSHGYTGDVYYTGGATSQTLSLPAGTNAFYFYVEPNPFSLQTCSATSGSTSTGSFPVAGSSGAKYVGFYGTSGTKLTSIVVTCDVDFATGEYGWSGGGGDFCDLDDNGTPGEGGDALRWFRGCKAGTLPLSDCDLNGDGSFKLLTDYRKWAAECK